MANGFTARIAPTMEELSQDFSFLQKKATPLAYVRTINRVASATRTESSKVIGQKNKISRRVINKRLQDKAMTRATVASRGAIVAGLMAPIDATELMTKRQRDTHKPGNKTEGGRQRTFISTGQFTFQRAFFVQVKPGRFKLFARFLAGGAWDPNAPYQSRRVGRSPIDKIQIPLLNDSGAAEDAADLMIDAGRRKMDEGFEVRFKHELAFEMEKRGWTRGQNVLRLPSGEVEFP